LNFSNGYLIHLDGNDMDMIRRRATLPGSINLTLLVVTLLLLGKPVKSNCAELPANLLISPKADSHHVILVEKATQQLFVYEFAGDYNLVATFSCATGEIPGDKQASGDQKTPEGVYFFVRAVGERYLSPTYGARAFPMNYPNPLDLKNHKRGNNIWVHGTNEELKKRSTNGCIVLANGDVVELENYIKLWDTPIIIEQELKYEKRDHLRHLGQLMLDRVEGWRQAWSQKDLPRYLAFYAADFRWRNLNLEGWRKRKNWLNQRYKKISVQLGDIRFFRQGDMVLAFADEIYRSDKFASRGSKQLYLVQNSEKWRIIREQWHKSDRPALPPLRLTAKPPAPKATAEQSVRLFVERWRRAWENGNIPEYLACYHPRFTARGMNLRGWSRYKRQLFDRSVERAIELKEIKSEITAHTAVVVFKQDYRSRTHQDFGLKTLRLRWHRGSWTIFRESWEPLIEEG
jgi:murein L,D-transpeptidase YafK